MVAVDGWLVVTLQLHLVGSETRQCAWLASTQYRCAAQLIEQQQSVIKTIEAINA